MIEWLEKYVEIEKMFECKIDKNMNETNDSPNLINSCKPSNFNDHAVSEKDNKEINPSNLTIKRITRPQAKLKSKQSEKTRRIGEKLDLS